MFKFKVTWDKIITDVFSSLILCIVGGAALIVWQGATTVEEKVDKATTSIKVQQDYLGKAILVIEKEIIELKEHDKEIDEKYNIKQSTEKESDPSTPSTEPDNFVVPQEQLNAPNTLPPLPVYEGKSDKIPNDLIRQQLPEQSSL